MLYIAGMPHRKKDWGEDDTDIETKPPSMSNYLNKNARILIHYFKKY